MAQFNPAPLIQNPKFKTNFVIRRYTTTTVNGRVVRTSADIPVEEGATDAILDAAEEVPYNVQLLAHACWEVCRATVTPKRGRRAKSERATLTPDLVIAVRNTVALWNDPIYAQLWSSLPPSQ